LKTQSTACKANEKIYFYMNFIYFCRKIISLEYIVEMNEILDAVEDIRPNITENQYNKIMGGLLWDRRSSMCASSTARL
jgi:hypothetical protein